MLNSRGGLDGRDAGPSGFPSGAAVSWRRARDRRLMSRR